MLIYTSMCDVHNYEAVEHRMVEHACRTKKLGYCDCSLIKKVILATLLFEILMGLDLVLFHRAWTTRGKTKMIRGFVILEITSDCESDLSLGSCSASNGRGIQSEGIIVREVLQTRSSLPK